MRAPNASLDADRRNHAGCDKHPCPKCAARDNLTPGDWEIVEFFELVRDQGIPLNPFGDKEGKIHLAPRLEAWPAVLRLYGYPADRWSRLTIGARHLWSVIYADYRTDGLFQINPEDLKDPAE